MDHYYERDHGEYKKVHSDWVPLEYYGGVHLPNQRKLREILNFKMWSFKKVKITDLQIIYHVVNWVYDHGADFETLCLVKNVPYVFHYFIGFEPDEIENELYSSIKIDDNFFDVEGNFKAVLREDSLGEYRCIGGKIFGSTFSKNLFTEYIENHFKKQKQTESS